MVGEAFAAFKAGIIGGQLRPYLAGMRGGGQKEQGGCEDGGRVLLWREISYLQCRRERKK